MNFEKFNHSKRFMLAVNAPLLICCILVYTIRKLLKSGGTGIDKLAVCTGDVNLLDVHEIKIGQVYYTVILSCCICKD